MLEQTPRSMEAYDAEIDRLADGQAATLGGMADAHAEQHRRHEGPARQARLAAVRAEEAEKCGCTWLSPLPPLSP